MKSGTTHWRPGMIASGSTPAVISVDQPAIFPDEMERMRSALIRIRDMQPSELAPETFPGLVHGPALLLENCQRIAREALRNGG